MLLDLKARIRSYVHNEVANKAIIMYYIIVNIFQVIKFKKLSSVINILYNKNICFSNFEMASTIILWQYVI